MAEKEIKVKVELTEGYQRRYTEACCRALARRKAGQNPAAVPAAGAAEMAEEAAV